MSHNGSQKKNSWFLAKPQKKDDVDTIPSNAEQNEDSEVAENEVIEENENTNEEPIVEETEKPVETSIFSRFKTSEPSKDPKEVGLSVICEDVVITGDVNASSNIELYGSVTGNVECGDMAIKVKGKITGNINAQNLTVSSKDIKGNVNCSKDVIIHQDAVVVGDIIAENVVCEGKVIGNINTSLFLDLKSSAVIDGDCAFGTLAIEKGGIINGNVKVNKK